LDLDLVASIVQLGQRPEVEYAEPAFVLTTFLTPNDPDFPCQWAHWVIGSRQAWDLSVGDQAILLAFIDTGISLSVDGELNHEDLSGGRYLLGQDLVAGGIPRDVTGHGTMMIGIAAANTNNYVGIAGVNWNSPVYVCKAFNQLEISDPALIKSAVLAITTLAKQRGKKVVINLSGGGEIDSDALRDACATADSPDVLFCCASGNTPTSVAYPAAYSTIFSRVIAVGATDEDDAVRSSSGRGPELTLAAPGANILTTTPSYHMPAAPGVIMRMDRCAGTSPATAFVSGVASLIWSARPALASEQVKDILIRSARKLAPVNFDPSWGYGRIDAARALQLATSLP